MRTEDLTDALPRGSRLEKLVSQLAEALAEGRSVIVNVIEVHDNTVYFPADQSTRQPTRQPTRCANEVPTRRAGGDAKERLAEILKRMESGHQMFCLFKGVVLAKKAASLREAEEKLKEIFPDGIPGRRYDMHELEFRLHVDSFAKPLEKWDLKDSPIKSQKTFETYYNRTEQIRDLFLETDLLI